jgi:hypothetical protein
MAVLSDKPQHSPDSTLHQMLTLQSVGMLTPRDPGMQCERNELKCSCIHRSYLLE